MSLQSWACQVGFSAPDSLAAKNALPSDSTNSRKDARGKKGEREKGTSLENNERCPLFRCSPPLRPRRAEAAAGTGRQNNAALLNVLAPYGVTIDRLDEVSNYYRYRRERSELWTHEPASIIANIRCGHIIGFTIEKPGAGYSSPPEISVPGVPGVKVKVVLSFGDDLKGNGSIAQVTIVRPDDTGSETTEEAGPVA